MSEPTSAVTADALSRPLLQRPATLFPLIRHLSYWVTPLLYRSPATPNQITACAMLCGLGASVAYAFDFYYWDVAAGLLMILCYVFDNCDGEIARLKNMRTKFGAAFDTFVDWLVNSTVFIGMGIGLWQRDGWAGWLWLAAAVALGGTINYISSTMHHRRHGTGVPDAPTAPKLATFRDRALFAFRELARADFCFILFAVALFRLEWLLLPAAAAGAQAYWITAFLKRSRTFHV
ncbi:MAG: CDP-alcohol phosphatidyltransferase family protein [Alphaproteobacteria bacterium]